MWMITPERFRAMIRAARELHKNAPVRLTAMTRSHQASSASRKWRIVSVSPALLTSTSTVPKRRTAVSITPSTWAGTETSAAAAAADPPRAVIAAATASAPAGATSLTTTCAPSSPKRTAIARPMPRAAPVTIATLPCIRVPTVITGLR